MNKPELLAPAGSKEALIAAIENGADAVYFGGEAYSARYDAALSNDDIEWAIDYAHINKTKSYATVNTLIKDSELEKVCEYLQFLCNAGVDAVIVQDMGILKLIKDQLPQLPVHASTQMTIHNVEGVRFLEDMGVKRVVLARELSLNEIRKIKSETNTEIEVFIHGALCFSYSGQCLFSSTIGDKSGNRGYCTQPCRRKYTIEGAKGHLLSPKDLNLSEHIGRLIESGIDSFKIEGRLKRPEYVAGVVRTYRMLIERYLENPVDFQVSYEEKHTLRQLFNRDFTSGYIFGNPGNELMSRKQSHNQGTYLGNVVKYDWDRKFAYIHIEQPLRIGDGIGTQGGTGTTVRSMYINNQSVETSPSCATVKIPMEKIIYRNETVFKTYDSKLMDSFGLKNIVNKIPITISFTSKLGKPITLCITNGENKVSIKGEIPQKAKGAPTSQESIIQQLTKLGNTFFESENVILELDDNIFIPISQLNSLRKIAVDKLKAELTKTWKRTCKNPEIIVNSRSGTSQPLLSVNTCSIKTFEAAVDNGADIVYFDIECVRDPPTKEDYEHVIEYAKKKGVKVYLKTPEIVKEFDPLNPAVNPDGFLVANLGDLYRFHNSIDKKSLIVDYPFNVFNKLTMTYYLDYCQRVTLSPELSLDEITHIASHGPVECIVHGFFPLMVSEHDLLGQLFPDDNVQNALLEDEKGFTYQITTNRQKRTYILNSRELCMLNYIPSLIESGVSCLRIEAKTYDKKTTAKWTQSYRTAIDNRTKDRCNAESITGHYFKGVL